MSAPRIATVADVTPVVEVGIGTYGPEGAEGRWDIARWDTPPDAQWAGAEPLWVDVTCDVHSVDTTVGHDRTLDAWDVGTCTITVDNEDGWADLTLDPLDPAALDLRPGRPVRWGIRRFVPGYVIPGTPGIDAYLNPTVGNVTTVDTNADRLHGTVRFRARFRYEGTLTVSALIAMQRASSATNVAWDYYVRYTDLAGVFRVSSSGTALEQSTAVTPDGVAVPDADHYLGVRWANSGTGTITTGERSVDGGLHWADVITSNRTALFTAFDSTAPVTVGGAVTGGAQRLPGRIFWAEMVQTNRSWVAFNGSAEALNVTGVGAWPDPLRMTARVTMPDPDVTLNSGDWPTIMGRRTGGGYDILWRRASATSRCTQLHWNDAAGVSQTIRSDPWAAGAIAPDQPVWLRCTMTATTVVFDYNLAQTFDPPTAGWVSCGSFPRPGAGGITAAQSTSAVRLGQTATTPYPWRGRIVRALARHDTTLAVMFDVHEDDVWPARTGGATEGSFTSASGHACTAVGGLRFIQPQPDAIVWRFDANEYTGTGTSYMDPRGRTWNLGAAGAIVKGRPAVPDVIVPDSYVTTYRFRGFIDAMRATYQGRHAETDSTTLECIDALGEVARVNLGAVDPPVGEGERLDARLHRILDVAGWRPSWRDIDTNGLAVMATALGAQAADLLGQTADTAGGALFGDYEGRVAFRRPYWQAWAPSDPPDLVLGNTAEAAVCPSTVEVSFPRAGTTTRSLVNYDGATTPPVQRDDVAAQTLYGVETAPERLDLQTTDPAQLDALAERLLASRGAGTMPRIDALTLDAGRDQATMLACLEADPQRPTRWRLVIERDGRLIIDRMLLVTSVSHSWDAAGWHAQVKLDDAEPWAAVGGRWDGAYWDSAAWSEQAVEAVRAAVRAEIGVATCP